MLLRQGFIYTYGVDKKQRPLIFLNTTMVDFTNNRKEDYESAINALIGAVIQHMFVPGRIEKYTFIIDVGGKGISSLPIDGLVKIISKLGVVYSLRLDKMVVLNLNYMLKLTYAALKPFIA